MSLENGSLLNDDHPRLRTNEIANITTPWNYLFDLKVDRTFKIGNFALTSYIYIQNLFNRKNVIHVYRRTGSTSADGSFQLYPGNKEFFESIHGEEFFILYDLINTQHRQHYQMTQGGDLFGRPREIRFGLQINFGMGRK